MAKFLADDHAAIAARLRELEAERRGDAPAWLAVPSSPNEDQSAPLPGFVMVDEWSEVDAEVWSAFEASRPGPVVQLKPLPLDHDWSKGG